VSPCEGAGLPAGAGGSPAVSGLETLSGRELQVLRLVSEGYTLRAIAQHLDLSEKTVAGYRARVSEKLGVSSKVELTRFALRHRLLE
jgi:two-component system, NarL family, invasion response regulator UvrY